MSTEPAQVNETDVPVITLAGKQWPVPLLAPRQNRKVVPLLVSVGLITDARSISEELYGKLLDIVYLALSRAHPNLARDEFDDMPIQTMELVNAIPTIAEQTGMLKAGEPGELQGSRQTGTTSSPTSPVPQAGNGITAKMP